MAGSGARNVLPLMERSESKEAETGSSRNWDELFDQFANALACENDSRKIRAMIKLAKMSNEAPESILELTVPMLLEFLGNHPKNPSLQVQEASAYCLKRIASRGELADIIGRSGAIPILLRLLPNSEESFCRALLKCLRTLVAFGIRNRAIMASHGGLEIIVAMITFCSGELKLILLEILSALALLREVRKFLWNTRRVNLLVEAASHGRMISRTRAAQAIGLLGLIKRARRPIFDVGAVPVLMNLLAEGDTAAKLVAGNALGVISSHVDNIRPIAQAGVIPLYSELLQGCDPTGKEVAEDVFCVLAVYEENAVAIVEHMVRILRGDNAGAKAAAADVIWDLSSYKYSSPVLQNSGVLAILVELLGDDSIDVRERVAGAVAQLSQNEGDRAILANCGAIPRLVNMLEGESEEVRDNAAEALVNLCLEPLVGGEEISRILENPTFRNMQGRVMQMRAADQQHMNVSLPNQLIWDPALF